MPWTLHARYRTAPEWAGLQQEHILAVAYPTKLSLINHSRAPNLTLFVSLFTEIHVMTTRAIRRGEELTLDYREQGLPTGWLESPEAAFL